MTDFFKYQWEYRRGELEIEVRGENGQIFKYHASQDQIDKIIKLGGIDSHTVIDVSCCDNGTVSFNVIGKNIGDGRWRGFAYNATQLPELETMLLQSLKFAERIAHEVNSYVAVIDANLNIVRFNALCEELTGKKEADMIGKSAMSLLAKADIAESTERTLDMFRTGVVTTAERTVNTVRGPRRIQWRSRFLDDEIDPSKRMIIVSGVDVTEERAAQLKLIEMASYDSLTGLLNRHAIQEYIHQAQKVPDATFGVLYLDLDDFKKINDHYGHLTGDKLIKKVALAIEDSFDGSGEDRIGRIGGDEFLVFIKDATIELLEHRARRIVDRLDLPFMVDRIEVFTGCSIGIAHYPTHGSTLEDLIRCADTAMYVAKSAGRHTYRTFNPDMNKKLAEFMWFDEHFRQAINSKQMELYYQPKVDLQTGKVESVEALVRWNSELKGMIPPSDFIPFAEESGMIVPLGFWAFKIAAQQAMKWRGQGIHLRIAVNISARQLRVPDLAERFMLILQQSQMDVCFLDLELTESCVVEDEAAAIRFIQKFREKGARIHLDDFGTGQSSLSQLTRLPLDAIKLDQSFVASVDVDPKAAGMVKAMVALARSQGLKVIGEGVETESQARYLKEMNVDIAQGFLYGRPMTAPMLEQWLSSLPRLSLVNCQHEITSKPVVHSIINRA